MFSITARPDYKVRALLTQVIVIMLVDLVAGKLKGWGNEEIGRWGEKATL